MNIGDLKVQPVKNLYCDYVFCPGVKRPALFVVVGETENGPVIMSFDKVKYIARGFDQHATPVCEVYCK